MISNDINIKNVVKLLKEHNIKDIVISPGGTNIKLVKEVQDDNYFTCYSVVDERSAMYVAIGIYLGTGRVVATSCTSAQATRNYIPGLTEAFYKHVPILAITMSKHPRFTYQDYMQAPDQTSLPVDCVKKSYKVPFISDKNDILYSSRIINEAMLELTHDEPGPVQLCIPALDNDLVGDYDELKTIKRYSLNDLNNFKEYLHNKRIMIVIGEHLRFDKNLSEYIEKFANGTNSVIYTNHLSNYGGEKAINANIVFSTIKASEFKNIKPDILISIGGQTGDYPFYNMLSRGDIGKIEHWRINKKGNVVDTYDKLTCIFEMSEMDFFKGFIFDEKGSDEYYNVWKKIIETKSNDVEVPFSNVYAAQRLSPMIKKDSIIQFSILNSLRIWNLFSLDKSIKCYSNVGAFGIDGGMSTLIGQSLVSGNDCYLIIGDLAFLYDLNSLSIRHIKNNLKILLINNNGGVEFKLYKNADDFKKTNKYIAAGNHFKNAEGWAKTCGFEYICASSKEEFDNLVDHFVNGSDKPIIFELFVKDTDEVEAYKKIIDSNSEYNFNDYISEMKSKLKKTVKIIIKK